MMTPSNRQHMTEQLRRIRVAEDRDPVDSAYFAIMALREDQLIALARRYTENQHHNGRPGATLIYIARAAK